MILKIRKKEDPFEAIKYTGGGSNYEEIADFLGDEVDVFAPDKEDFLTIVIKAKRMTFNLNIGEYVFKTSNGLVGKITQEIIDRSWEIVKEHSNKTIPPDVSWVAHLGFFLHSYNAEKDEYVFYNLGGTWAVLLYPNIRSLETYKDATETKRYSYESMDDLKEKLTNYGKIPSI